MTTERWIFLNGKLSQANKTRFADNGIKADKPQTKSYFGVMGENERTRLEANRNRNIHRDTTLRTLHYRERSRMHRATHTRV